MGLMRMDALLVEARRKRMAIGGFECWSSAGARAIAEAAAECRMPVIFQATRAEYELMGGAAAMKAIVECYVEQAGIDAALHLDHGASMEEVRTCLDGGFSSVMLDASRLPLEENIAASSEAAGAAHEASCSIEAELGHVGGFEGDLEEVDDEQAGLTDPEEAERFVAETGIDCLAVGIGTVHGEYRREPNLDLDRLARIADRVPLPLVLHGGSGVTDELLLQAIERGIAKINICTDIHKVWIAAVTAARETRTPSLAGRYYEPAQEALKTSIAGIIQKFANGKSW
ncbi:class II fructose-bisphosphate aldolase [Kiritimatiella glycovorans]|uniref:Putative fructose-bisphosphate aldolase n=1 Tax=Kiritimatiella glycovorans TaxID=1307763 RepID=A0A0G3EGF0_9BACT|nr:class II fructose-bisphosphate aldolase [Kiritimatiella glycovorans]AKJ64487.1 putative fructose-bisphosphate aldolase [Kiritimatiella glycovorans]